MERYKGTVKWFSRRLGYGFILLDDGREIFCHENQLDKSFLVEGDSVEISLQDHPKGPTACDVQRIVEAGPGECIRARHEAFDALGATS